MQPFAYTRATEPSEALALAGGTTAFIAGGTDLLPLWKAGIARPARVIDISRLPLATIHCREDGITLGALASLSDTTDHPVIGARYPLIAEALAAGASGQVRNMATIGGNLLQRTRCAYFRSGDLPCNKRSPGSGCAAMDGENRGHAIFGGSAQCIATHASDLAVALVALDAVVRIAGPGDGRSVPVEAFFRPPGDTPERETVLAPGELITAVDVPAFDATGTRYLKIRDRASFEFAVVSVAAALRIENGAFRAARLAAGGVGTVPWRLRAAEAVLDGARFEPAALTAAAEAAIAGAEARRDNAFKVELLRRAVIRALEEAGRVG